MRTSLNLALALTQPLASVLRPWPTFLAGPCSVLKVRRLRMSAPTRDRKTPECKEWDERGICSIGSLGRRCRVVKPSRPNRFDYLHASTPKTPEVTNDVRADPTVPSQRRSGLIRLDPTSCLHASQTFSRSSQFKVLHLARERRHSPFGVPALAGSFGVPPSGGRAPAGSLNEPPEGGTPNQVAHDDLSHRAPSNPAATERIRLNPGCSDLGRTRFHGRGARMLERPVSLLSVEFRVRYCYA